MSLMGERMRWGDCRWVGGRRTYGHCPYAFETIGLVWTARDAPELILPAYE